MCKPYVSVALALQIADPRFQEYAIFDQRFYTITSIEDVESITYPLQFLALQPSDPRFSGICHL